MQLNIKTPDSVEEITALRTLFEDYLKGVYWSEKALVPVFSDMIAYIRSHDIARMLLEHTANTQIHADRIEKIFDSIGIKPEEKKFEAIDSLINDIDLSIEQIRSGAVRDAAIIALIQHIIHCEIASYGTLKSFAITLKEEDVVTLLEKSLQEEKEFDLKLSVIAEAYINDEAANKEF
jgi:ferritin-like metal-binding protein YciE